MDDVLQDSASSIGGLQALAARAQCVFLVGDASGVVVHRYGPAGDRLGQALDPGSVWSESMVGNNALGTCLAERQGVTVHRTDHLLRILHPYSCTAVPLWDSEHRIFGAIDLTTLATAHTHLPFLRHALEHAALRVHCALFARAHRRHTLVELARGPLDPIARSDALLAIDDDGVLVGLSRSASAMWSTDPGATPTTPLGALLQGDLGADLAALSKTAIGSTARSAGWTLRVMRKPVSSKRSRRRLPTRSAPPPPATPDLQQLAGRDPTMLRHLRVIRRIMNTDLPIMLGGETGTGKDALARAIHAASCRHDGPFIAVNCASLPPNLLDSELFGYAPGTFTGGLKGGKRGKIEASSGGTLFLDEIGDMPLHLQGRLLRVLANREVTRLGAVEPIPVDLQLITATNRDLQALVAEGRFREDVYYRLRGAAFTLPALRDRADLADFLHRLLPPDVSLAPPARRQLLSYGWPGNIRQLKRVLVFAAACTEDGVITIDDLPPEIKETPAAAPLNVARQTSERAALLHTLEACSWNVSKAAVQLGISRSTAHRKMRQFEIRRPRP
ncbi:MAG: sigma-54-dependent Fis family transcriptional regulator [Myxococcota bacterium]